MLADFLLTCTALWVGEAEYVKTLKSFSSNKGCNGAWEPQGSARGKRVIS